MVSRSLTQNILAKNLTTILLEYANHCQTPYHYLFAIANTLNTTSSTGFDNIYTNIIRNTIITGTVPEKLKIAKIVPIFKSGNNAYFNNYRPISILPTLSKVLYKIVCNIYINNIYYINTNMDFDRNTPLPIQYYN